MADGLNPAAPHHLPGFLVDASGSDPLLGVTAVIVITATVAAGVIFFWLHALPERIAHRTEKTQMELVTVLCLLALFTHIHLFWIVALLLAVIDLPSMISPMHRITGSLDRIAERLPQPAATGAAAPVSDAGADAVRQTGSATDAPEARA